MLVEDIVLTHPRCYDLRATAVRILNRAWGVGDVEQKTALSGVMIHAYTKSFADGYYDAVTDSPSIPREYLPMYFLDELRQVVYRGNMLTEGGPAIKVDLATLALAVAQAPSPVPAVNRVVTMGTFASSIRGYIPIFATGSIDNNTMLPTVNINIVNMYATTGSAQLVFHPKVNAMPTGFAYPLTFRINTFGYELDFIQPAYDVDCVIINAEAAAAILAIPDGGLVPFTIRLVPAGY